MITFYLLLGLIFFLATIWLLMPILYGVPWRPTQMERIRKALRLADLKPGEVIYDLGAGDGRVVILAAREFDAYGVGIEAGILQILLGRVMTQINGVSSRVRLLRGDFYRADLSEADVIFAYLTSDQSPRLQQVLAKQLKPGTRIVTISFDLQGWQPQAFDRDDLIFLYWMPPTEGSLSTFLETRK